MTHPVYRLPATHKDTAQAVISQMMHDGVMEQSDCEYINPVVIVKNIGSLLASVLTSEL